jgi:hypothetical protein
MAVRQARAKRLRELSLKRLEVTHQARLAMGLALQDVLFESKSRGPDGQEDWYSGYSPNYFRTWVKAPHSGESLTNVIRTVQAEQVWLHRASGDAGLMGTLISDSIKSH